MACGASAGTAASEWLRRGESLLARRPEQARACFSDAALADPLSYRPVEQLGLAQLDQQANVPLSTAAATLRRAAHLALRQGNQSAAAAVHRAVGEAHARRQDWAPASTGGGGTSPVDDCGVHGRSIWLSPRAGATAAQGARLLLRRRHKGVAEPTVCSRLRISRPRICRSNFARSREKRTWRKKISATATRISSALTSAGVLISSGGDSEGGGGSGGDEGGDSGSAT